MGGSIHLTDSSFDQAVQEHEFLLVHFWTERCFWCGILEQIIRVISESCADRMVLGKLNVDENPMTAVKYGVEEVPMIFIIRNGITADKIVGLQPPRELLRRILRHLWGGN